MEVEFHPEASAEFMAASAYYEAEVPGLGDAFVNELERVVALIRQHPFIGSQVDETFRRVVLARFPFSVFYFISPKGSRVLIVAVAHQRRKPGYWRHRIAQ